MKRFLLFTGDAACSHGCPCLVGGWNDFQGHFSSIEEAEDSFDIKHVDWYQIIDTVTARTIGPDEHRASRQPVEKTAPNCGIPFHLGSYKVEVFVTTVPGQSKRLVIADEGNCVGLNPDELIDRLQADIENLRHTARRCVADAIKERDGEGG